MDAEPLPPVVIATTTFYRPGDERRAEVCLQMITEAVARGWEIVVVDGGSTIPFVDEAARLGAHVFDEVRGEGHTMGRGRRQAIAAAADLAGRDGVIIWTEEKPKLMELLGDAISLVRRGVADIVVPNRAGGMETLPTAQYYAEHYGNHLWHMLFGGGGKFPAIVDTSNGPIDWWVGVRVMSYGAALYFTEYDGRHGDKWSSIFVPAVLAATAGLTVTGCPIFGYVYEQGWEDDDVQKADKSRIQLNDLVPAGTALLEELRGLSAA